MQTRRATWIAFGAAVVMGFGLACVVDLPPNGKYTCTSNADCGGDGYVCTPDGAGPRYCCKPSGPEVCDGKDNDCNGVVDDISADPCYDGPVETVGVGPCHGGTKACVDGGMICAGQVLPSPEVCNNADDNCNGVKDDGFDFKNDPNNCGACGVGCALPLRCQDGGCAILIETNCWDGIDNDLDNAIDCRDSDCAGQSCSPDGGCVCRNFAKVETACGDGIDNDNDTAVDCADSDCDGGSCGPGCQCQRGAAAEIQCWDGIDNDKDGPIDCADLSDCTGQNCNPDGGNGCTCLGGVKTESACFGGLDEDGDGLIDCMDPDCDGGACSASGCQCRQGGKVETNCGDLLDNDGDGTFDKCDLDCSTTGCGNGCTCDGGIGGGTPPGVPAETICNDGLDNDGDGLIDCLDILDCLNQVCNASGTKHCNSSKQCR